MRVACSALLTLVGLIAAVGPATAQECFFDESAEVSRVTLADGTVVRHYRSHLRVGDRMLSPCNGLPAEHPTAITAFGDGLAIGFRAGGVHLYRAGSFEALADALPPNVRALASGGGVLYIGTTSGLFQYSEGRVRALGVGRFRRVITALATEGDTLHVGVDPTGWWKKTGDGPFRVVRRRQPVGCFETGRRVTALPPGPDCSPPTARSSHFTAVATHGGQVFFASFDRGLVVRDARGRFVPVPGSPRYINTLLSDGDTLWIGTAQGLYSRHRGGFSRVRLGLPSQHVNGLWRSTTGELWIATGAGLVGVRDGRTRLLDHRNGLPSRIVYAVTETDDGALWVGTAEGAARISTDGISTYRRESGNLPHNWVTAVVPDGDGVIVGTYDSGVARLHPVGTAEPIAGLEELWVNPHGVQRRGGRLYVSTLGDGLWVYGDGEAHRVTGLPSLDVTGVALADGDLWVATRGGLARVEGSAH